MIAAFLSRLAQSPAARIAAPIVGILGLVLSALAYSGWKEYRSYTETAEWTVSHRTATSCVVFREGELPGGRGAWELSYGNISGARNAVPPADGPPLAVGDQVELVHPPGKPQEARLKESLKPAVPPWLGWVGFAGLVLAAIVITVIVTLSPRRSAAVDRRVVAAHAAS